MMIRNQKGFSFPELVVGIGLSAIVISVVIAVQVQMTKDQSLLIKQLDDSVDQNLAERIVFKDLNGIEVAYNNIVVNDDNGNNFFDFYPDITETALSGTLKKLDRDFTLNYTGKKEFIVVTQNAGAGALLNYDPVWAYDVGPDPGDPNTPATLLFNASKNRKWISNEGNGGRKDFWRDGVILMYDTSSRIRQPVNGVIDMKTIPRSPIYVASVSSQTDSLQPLSSLVSGMFKNTHPYSGKTIDSLDSFLRTLPSVGGGQTIVRLRAIKIVRYYVTLDDTKNVSEYKVQPLKLYMSEYRNGAWSGETMLADGIEKMTFRRDSIVKRMIYFKISKAERKDGRSY